MLSKALARVEVYNDIDDVIVNVFRVLRDPESAIELQRLLHLTPYARRELEIAYDRSDDPIEDARRTIVRGFLGIGADAVTRRVKTGFRRQMMRRNGQSISDWWGYPPCVEAFCERLRRVIIESRPAMEIIGAYDSPETLHYLDPPYMHSVRSGSGGYGNEMTDADHRELLEFLLTVEGMVVLSGYHSATYDEALCLSGWERRSMGAQNDGRKPTIECLWVNPAAVAAQQQQSLSF